MPTTMEEDDSLEWEDGLPAPDELMPLTQSLIPPDLASAFSIMQEKVQLGCRQPMVATLHRHQNVSSSPDTSPLITVREDRNFGSGFEVIPDKGHSIDRSIGAYFVAGSVVTEGILQEEPLHHGMNRLSAQSRGNSQGFGDNTSVPLDGIAQSVLEKKSDTGCVGGTDSSDDGGGGSLAKKLRKQSEMEYEDAADSGVAPGNSSEEPTARTLKRPRLVWTPQLHKRFVDAVAHLGIKNAVPKTIMQLMNVDGLTRENVASHLQKYRLYLKRMQTVSSDGHCAPSLVTSTHFFSNHREDLVPVVVPMPITGLGHAHMVTHLGTQGPYANFEHQMYNAIAKAPTQRFPAADCQKYVTDNHGGPASPQRQILTLFPANGH